MKKIILLTLFALTANSSTLEVRGVENTNRTKTVPTAELGVTTGGRPPCADNLGYDVVDDKTNKIGRIYKVTPSYVWVIYDRDTGGRKIPRQELPPELKVRFPYDAAQAAEYQKQQFELAARQVAAQAAAARQAARLREREIENEIAMLKVQDTEIQKEAGILKSLGGGNGRRVKLGHLRDQQQAIRERVLGLRSQLEQLRALRDRSP